METMFLKAVAGTDENTGRGEVVVFAGGSDLDSLVDHVADGVGELMLKHALSPRFGGQIRVVWVPEKLPTVTPFAELQSRVCDQILRLDLDTVRDIKLSFQVGV